MKSINEINLEIEMAKKEFIIAETKLRIARNGRSTAIVPIVKIMSDVEYKVIKELKEEYKEDDYVLR
jgi:hypothetical protein